ncbi:MAG: NAD(P)H-hydrate dehydratase [Burkholderiaceae bacterium]|nr:NAD(P)H-hydrate dehydratase [Burkholderiaceae bacterium]
MRSAATDADAVEVDDACLRGWPLPQPDADGDKEERGRVLVIAGSREMPGALILAANAALNAGAGKLTVATAASVARLVATALPEARVIELAETEAGGTDRSAIERVRQLLPHVDAVLIGPGMQDEPAVCEFCAGLLDHLSTSTLVLDAAAMGVVRGPAPTIESFASATILTPHAGELAHLTGDDKEAICDRPASAALGAARHWNAIVALKGATTFIAAPDGSLWRHAGGNVGLAISGSGDVLAGLIAGLASRGVPPAQAAVWGVALHARAGEQLATRSGPLGYLARDLSAEVPALMAALTG